jgi:hypothetical protein
MVFGIGVNAVGVTIAARRLWRTPLVDSHRDVETDACVAA